MSEIAKLYENAGVDYEERYNNCTLNKEGECKLKCSCDICKYSEEKYIYPPFTAEKQIELIKWLILNYSTEIIKGRYTNYFMSTGRSYKASGNDDLIICMANLINTLWQDLTETEQEEIKEILK